MIVELLWVALFLIVVLACFVGLYFITNVREPEIALGHARNVLVGAIVIGLIGAAWILVEVL